MVRVRPFALVDHDALALEVDAVVARLRVYRHGCLDKRQFLRPDQGGAGLGQRHDPVDALDDLVPFRDRLDRVAFVGIRAQRSSVACRSW